MRTVVGKEPYTTGKSELSVGQINFHRLEANPMKVTQLSSAEGRADES
jgi:hypothetical protein